MSTGISVHDDVVTEWGSFKKNSCKTRFVTFKMSDDMTEIVLDHKSDEGISYADFVEYLTSNHPNEPRYAVVRYDYTREDDGQREKLIFVLWAPDSSKIKQKMLYAATKDTLKKKLPGSTCKPGTWSHPAAAIEIQATDAGEISSEELLEKCNQISR